jgi:hypothetical protein
MIKTKTIIKKNKKYSNNKDYMLISKQLTSSIIKILLPDKKIRCDLSDRNGKIGILIKNVKIDYSNDIALLELDNNEKVNLDDRYLYNIVYNNIKNEYMLLEHDEYHEKIELK